MTKTHEMVPHFVCNKCSRVRREQKQPPYSRTILVAKLQPCIRFHLHLSELCFLVLIFHFYPKVKFLTNEGNESVPVRVNISRWPNLPPSKVTNHSTGIHVLYFVVIIVTYETYTELYRQEEKRR